jgi:hypothetical protein
MSDQSSPNAKASDAPVPEASGVTATTAEDKETLTSTTTHHRQVSSVESSAPQSPSSISISDDVEKLHENDDPKKDEVREEGEALEKVTSNVENYPTGMKLILTLCSIYFTVFLVALDRTIIATALPTITNKFNSFSDVGWVSSGYLFRHG